MRRLLSFFSMVFTILAVLFFTLPSIKNPNLGIEFKGGYEVVYEISEKDDAELPALEDIADVIAQRIDIAGVKNPQVSVENTPGSSDSSRIRVCVSSKDTNELAEVLTLIESDTEITFTDDEGNFLMDGTVLKETDGAILSYEDGVPIVLLNIADTKTFGEKTGSIAGKNMIAWIGYEGPNEETGYIGDFAAYSGQGTQEEYASAAKKIIVNAGVNESITSETAKITGSFTAQEASQIGKLLSAGNMNFEITRTDVMKVDGAFGAEAFNKSLIAGLVGLLAIIVMMICIYKISGVISSITLLFYTAAILVVFNMIGGEYGPDTIAAIVIGLGMAVDACIILFERFTDELYKGRSVKAAYEESTKKSLSSILDSNITTIIAACALYFFGKRSVKGFATMLLITTVFNVVIMLLVTRLLMFLLIKSGKLDDKKHLLGVDVKKIPDINKGEVQTYFGRFNKVNFVKYSKKVLIGLCCLFGLGIGFAGGSTIVGAVNGTGAYPLNFGLDFLPGATATINFNDYDKFAELEDMQLILDEKGEITQQSIIKFLDENTTINDDQLPKADDISIVKEYNAETECNTLSIKIEFTNVATDNSSTDFLTGFDELVTNQLGLVTVADYEDYVNVSQQVSSPTMAKATVINALLSLAIAFALIIVYISVRFRFTYAISSIVALLFDTMSMLAIFAIFRIEVQVEFVSAVLAIIGYSINDTVVIFDRIREIAKETNFGNIDEAGRKNIVNKALQNCATRSFWTTISTMLPVVALIFLGASATVEFSIAMFVGLISGIFSSLFIAPASWLIFEKRHHRRLKEKAIREAEMVGKKKSTGPEEMTIIGIND